MAVRGLTAGAPGTGAAGWEHGAREAVISGLDAAIQSLTLYRGQVLLAHKDDGRWGTALDRDFADWRARSTGAGRGPAVGELQIAEGLQAMPEVADAVAGGDLTLEHARALTRLRATASEEVKAALEAGAGADLLEKAKSLSAPELAREAKKVAATIDAHAAQDRYDAVWRRRSVTTHRSAGGRAGAWFLDDIGGTIVETALDAIVGKPAKDDVRTREQRRADALVTMASRVLQVGADRNGAQIRPHLALIVSEETWDANLRRRQATREGRPAGDRCGRRLAGCSVRARRGRPPDGRGHASGPRRPDPARPGGSSSPTCPRCPTCRPPSSRTVRWSPAPSSTGSCATARSPASS